MEGPPQESGNWLQRVVLGVARQLMLRAAFLVGALVLAVGLALLSAAWVVGPRLVLMERELARMIVVTDARLIEPYWVIDFDFERWRPDRHWAPLLRTRPCVGVEYLQTGQLYRQRLCGAERGGRIRFELADLIEDDQLMAGVPLRWPLDAEGQPLAELRMRPEVRAHLAAMALLPQEWPEQPQTEALRDRPQPTRNALDRLQVALDQPLEWLLRGWPVGDVPTIPLRLNPAAPEQALPAAFVAAVRAESTPSGLAIFLLGAGLLVYGYGLSVAFMGLDWRRRGLIGIGILLVFPLWGGWTGTLLQRHAPDAWTVGRDMAADLASPGTLALERLEPDAHHDLLRMAWPAWGAQSAYADLIVPLELQRPVPPPVDADAALRAASAQVVQHLLSLDDAAAQRLFDALAQAHREGRDAVGLLYLEAAREFALSPDRDAAARQAAVRFLQRLVLSSRQQPHPQQRAFAARLDLWRSLIGFTADPAVAHLAASVVERAQAPIHGPAQ